MNFWKRLKDIHSASGTPILTLAPMADVTDPAFRCMIAKYSSHMRADGTIGGPDVMWTEFVSADGLVHAHEEGKKKLLACLQFSPGERPIVAQLFTSNPANMEYAARLCAELGFDGIDINMGCPDRAVEKQGCGSAMIKNPINAQAVIAAAQKGFSYDGVPRPVSVKTRLGYNTDILEEWLPALLEMSPAAVTIHARTRKDMSKVDARWERVLRAVQIRDEQKSSALIIGNGDVSSLKDAHEKAKYAHTNGIMLGRAIFGNPWLFHPEREKEDITLKERLMVLNEHTHLYENLLPHKNFAFMKKHYKAYVCGFDGAVTLRTWLMCAENAREVDDIIQSYIHDQGLF